MATEKKKDTKEDKGYTALPHFGLDRLLPYLRPYRGVFVLMILLGLVSSGAIVVIPLFQRYAISTIIPTGALSSLWTLGALYLGTVALQVCCDLITTYHAARVELFVNRDLKRASFNHLQTLSFSYFNQNSVGYIHARVMSDTSRIGELVSWGLMTVVWNLSYLVFALVMLFSINARLAALIAVILPVAGVLVAIFQGKMVRVNRRVRELNSRITGNFNEGITGAKTVKSLVIEDKMDEHFRVDALAMQKDSVRATHFRALFASTVSFASSFALALVLWQSGLITAEGVGKIGTLSVFMSFALEVMNPVQELVDSFSTLITAQVNIERLTNLLETKSDVTDSPEVIARYGDSFLPKFENWEPLHGDVEFRDVTFRYPDGAENVLEHFNLTVAQGQNVAIVGETGAGKSTLVNLVCRFYEPTEGAVLIDGRDARERSQLWLHRNIGYVLQTPYLFTGTVRENLRYGNPEATDEQIWAALERVSATQVVKRMEKGLDSEVGEGGDLLSTGEKQLLSFARALLADPRILVLDEATSSVDTMTEYAIQKAIGEVTSGRTSFVIAHRLSTIRSADVILAVRAGKIVERGTHTELMRRKGYYYSLYTRQFEEEEIEKIL